MQVLLHMNAIPTVDIWQFQCYYVIFVHTYYNTLKNGIWNREGLNVLTPPLSTPKSNGRFLPTTPTTQRRLKLCTSLLFKISPFTRIIEPYTNAATTKSRSYFELFIGSHNNEINDLFWNTEVWIVSISSAWHVKLSAQLKLIQNSFKTVLETVSKLFSFSFVSTVRLCSRLTALWRYINFVLLLLLTR